MGPRMTYLYDRMRRFFAFIAGFVFFVGGVLKLLDPVGAGLVMAEYFRFLHVGFLLPAAKISALFFALAETLLGAMMITGLWRKVAGTAALVFQGFFTLLTLLLVIFNPEMHCGCFGEAIHLTHTQTFVKNIVLCVMIAFAYIPYRSLGRPKKKKYVSFALVSLSVFAFALYGYMYIPLVDFTDYKPGTVLASADVEQETEAYESVFVYEKDGKQERFTLDALPDSTWTFISTETVSLKPELENVALSFYNDDVEYCDSLAAEGRVMIVSVYDPDKMTPEKWDQAATVLADAEAAGFTALLLVSGDAGQRALNMYQSDYKTLITLNRSNGGVTYISGGYIIRKWARRAAPDFNELQEVYSGDDTETIIGHSSEASLGLQAFLLYVFAIMLLL